MAINTNFPNVRPSLLLDFANAQQLDPRVTFSRSTTAPYYDGKTSVVAEQNLFIQSNTFSNAAWVATSATIASGVTDPAGGTTAFSMTATAGNATLYQTLTLTATAYTESIWIQRVTGTGTINLTLDGSTLSPVTITSSWAKYTYTATPSAGSRTIGIQIVTSGDAINIYGSQLENRSSATATNITTTTAITNYIPQLQTAPINAPRFDFNPTTGESLGLLIEQSSTNLELYSQSFDNAYWNKANSTITTTANIAPDGTQTMQLFVPNNGATIGAATNLYRSVTLAAGSITLSVYAKAKELTTFTLQDGSGNGGNFNLSTVTPINVGTGVATITSVGNGVYRCVATIASAGANPNWFFYATAGTANGYNGIYIWGAQLEALAFPTSYIATTSAQVTRASDNASMTGTNFSSWYNNGAQGTFYSDLNFINNVNAYVVGFSSSFYTSPLRTFGGTQWEMFDGVSDKIFNSGSPTTTNTNYKVAVSWANGATSSLCQNGSVIGTVTPAGYFTGFTGITIGAQPNSATITSIRIKKLAYYPINFTNAQNQALTGT